MKSTFSLLIGAFVILACTHSALANDLRDMLFGNRVPNCIAARECDDYCPKQTPCTQPTCKVQCNDYCPKPIPCTQPTCNGQCDDYCAKPLPNVCCAKCVPPQSCQICRSQSDLKPTAVLANPDAFLIPGSVKQTRKLGSKMHNFRR